MAPGGPLGATLPGRADRRNLETKREYARAVGMPEDVVSPELVLVSPPDLAARAREALPDYERESAVWIRRVRVAVEEAAAEQQRRERRFMVGAVTFTSLMALNAAAPVILFLLFR
jgi:hypothetical protein